VAVIWALHSSRVGGATFLVVWAVATELFNYLLQPVLLGKSVRLPVMVTLAGVVGGLLAFGLIGLFVGPVSLAMTYTFLKAWVQGDATGSTAETSAQPR
jgi:predicted PurR-regulated permease PerM